MPDAVQGVLSARIDPLPETHKRVLQIASVLGREFFPRLPGEMWDGASSLDMLLATLQRLEFLFARIGQRQQAVQSLQTALDEGMRCEDNVVMGGAHALLTLERSFAGQLQQRIAHGDQAVPLLEQTPERFWLGTSLYLLRLSSLQTGDFHRAVETATRVYTLGETIGDRRLQVNALTTEVEPQELTEGSS